MYRDYVEEFSYRTYVTNLMGDYLGANVRWSDLVCEREEIDAQAIVSSVIDRAGLEVTE